MAKMYSDSEHTNKLDLITRYLANEVTEEEKSELESWLAENESNQQTFDQYKDAWNDVDKAKDQMTIDVGAEWKLMQAKMESLGDSDKIISIDTPARGFQYSRLLRYAAILLIFLVSSTSIYYYFKFSQTTTVTARAEMKESSLPDGSTFALNRYSSLKYDKDYGKQDRRVILKGEVYFDVEPDSTRPFIIDAGPVIVTVLGTSFYINASEENDLVEVIVESGTVSVAYKSDSANNVVLTKGDKAEFKLIDNTLLKLPNTDVNYLSWKTRRLVFKDKKLKKVVKSLNKVYNSNIVIECDEIKNRRDTHTFDNKTLEQILNILKATHNLEIKYSGNTIILTREGCE
ncbi:MAG: FecR domain-containing protein [Bacteroidetes bacterium]|nr:FecR domain-containing protein [Bacteroidota bacterium]